MTRFSGDASFFVEASNLDEASDLFFGLLADLPDSDGWLQFLSASLGPDDEEGA